MRSKYDNFVGVYDDCVSDELFNGVINYFERCQNNNRTYSRPEPENIKKDDAISLDPHSIQEINFSFPQVQNYISEFNDVFWNKCYAEYTNKFSSLKEYDLHTIYSYKVQKTIPTGVLS